MCMGEIMREKERKKREERERRGTERNIKEGRKKGREEKRKGKKKKGRKEYKEISIWKVRRTEERKEIFYFNNNIFNKCEGLPWWLNGKESSCQCRIQGFDP